MDKEYIKKRIDSLRTLAKEKREYQQQAMQDMKEIETLEDRTIDVFYNDEGEKLPF